DNELLDVVRRHRELRVILTARDSQRHEQWHAIDLDLDIITGDDLRFTALESHELIKNIYPAATDSQSDEIHQQVGGWPILVRAAALADGDLRGAIAYLRSKEMGVAINDESQKFAWLTVHARNFTEEMARFLIGAEYNPDVLTRFRFAGLVD